MTSPERIFLIPYECGDNPDAIAIAFPHKLFGTHEYVRADLVVKDMLGRGEHDDDLDGVLFRFWCRAASYPGGWPTELIVAFTEHGPCGGKPMEPHHYRAALMAVAKAHGVNLPQEE